MTRSRKPRQTIYLGITSLLLCTTAGFAEDDKERTPHLYETPTERRDVAGIILREGISVGGLIEVEMSAGKKDGETTSDITLATFELGVQAELSEWVQGRALLLWSEDDTDPVTLDEAMIILGGNTTCPAYIEVGRMYIPFGMFDSHFISDPLTLELAETRESSVLVGYAHGMLDIKAGAFSGDMGNERNEVRDTFAAVTLRPGKQLQIGGYWISDLGESDTLEEMIIGNTEASDTVHANQFDTGGAGGFISLRVGRFVADAEYITALDNFTSGTLGKTELRPAAWNIEAGLRFSKREAEIALKHEGCRDFPGFPRKQYGIGSSMKLSESSTLAIEFLHGTFEDNTEDQDVVTAQLAMEF